MLTSPVIEPGKMVYVVKGYVDIEEKVWCGIDLSYGAGRGTGL